MFTEILNTIKDNQKLRVSGLRGAAPAWLTAQLATHRNCCCIVPDEHMVSVFEQDVKLFTQEQTISYPGYEIPAYTRLSPDQQTTASRLSALYHLQAHQGRKLVITSIEALVRRVLPHTVLSASAEWLVANESCDLELLQQRLIILGYDQVSLVQTVGDFAVRGGIIDIYPPPFLDETGILHDGPIRLDFFGDIIESLRHFDPITQRSITDIAEATLLPVHDVVIQQSNQDTRTAITSALRKQAKALNWDEEESQRMIDRIATGRRFAGMEFFLPIFYEQEKTTTSTVFDYLPKDMMLLLVEPEAIAQNLELIEQRILQNFHEAQSTQHPALPPESIFILQKDLEKKLQNYQTIAFSDFGDTKLPEVTIPTSNHQLLKQEITIHRSKTGLFKPLSNAISSWQQHDEKVVLCCRSLRHTQKMAELFDAHQHHLEIIEAPLQLDAPLSDSATLFLCNHPLSAGFSVPEQRLHILSEAELFGEMRIGRRKKRTRSQQQASLCFTELNNGDIVVHVDHGLGVYHGMQTMDIQGVTNDFMLIEYRDGDRLYLPVDRLNLISKYEGLSDKQPKIDKLGTHTWKATKAKVKEEVWKVAHELLDIYAKRELQKGRQFSHPGSLFAELEESFPYDETPGQNQAINDVLADLTSTQPMDRLVCGDVGYGKTEVAIRAAFKVVEDNMQVAILVPTTVLAEQHAKTFQERLASFPLNVQCINRFRSPAKQRAIIKDLAQGKIDILIGTHRLLSKDIQFKALGLLIVDEEHRFGVSHKEKIKKMRSEVDILTLTATPIPRTLQMSLLGIRDLSVISSPPEQRRPIKTFVARYDNLVVKEAVSRELRRGGQTFFIHNRVRSIYRVASNIAKLVPEARIAVAHGQMAGKELEEIMVRFVNREIDVLVSTTIVESGLDIPSANTIIINRADMLGLAEIYQLRGRVGRSSTQSFAYLLVPSIDSLSKNSRDRLRALMDSNELGGGFKLAMNDLQIRGGGNLLGVSQSGHIAAIGYDLYLDLLQKTVADLKTRAQRGEEQREIDDEFDPEISLRLSAYIPEAYMMDIGQRYVTYRRIAALSHGTASEHADLQNELEDRYGSLPQETQNLFQVVALKRRLKKLRIHKLEKGQDNLVASFQPDTPVTPEKLLNFLQSKTNSKRKTPARLTPDGRLVIKAAMPTTDTVFNVADDLISTLEKMVTKNI